jgi:hypothetical protein
MLGSVFVANVVVVTSAMAVFTRVLKHQWVIVFALIAAFECALTGKASPSWEAQHVAASWLLGNVIPWGAVAIYLWLTPYPRRAILVASGVPLVYLIAVVIGLTYGDSSGLIPQ